MMLDATRHYDKPPTSERLTPGRRRFFQPAATICDRSASASSVMIDRDACRWSQALSARQRVAAQAAMDPVCRAGLAHLWFVTIHRFDDGKPPM
jgi:hypothetical protein